MDLPGIRTKVGLVAATVVVGIGVGAAPASAGTNVSSWTDHCNYTDAWGCLYYSPNGAGGIFKGYGYYPNLSGYTFSDGHAVRNDAASIGNWTSNCLSVTWVYPDAGGDYNWVTSGRGGNLTWNLRNNEASFDATNNCQ